MLVREIHSKSILNKSGIADYCINPYTGCSHACAYCYARFMRRFSQHKEEWGDFVDVKVDAPQILARQMKAAKRGSIYLSSVTDPYQPLEKEYRLTRRSLEVLANYDSPVSIQTKSSLILRDLDVLKELAHCEVGFTITALDEEARRRFEPHSSPIGERLNALEILREAGISTYIFFGPMLPLLSEENLEETIERFSMLADYIYFDKLNIKYDNWPPIRKVLEQFYPGLVEKYREILFRPNDYYYWLKHRVEELCRRYSLDYHSCY